MSMYSGKCDVYDSLVMIHEYTDEELKNNVKIYIGSNDESLHIESQKDLIPYYPHLIGSAVFDTKEKKSVIHITSKSFVDIEEEESLNLYLKWLFRIYDRCKRKKIEFNVEDAIKELCWDDYNKEEMTELAKRVKKHGKKATIDGIHFKFKDYYRQKLVNEMIRNNIDPTEYGYGRFVEEG